MLKEVFIKIGQHTIKIYKNLSKNKQKVNEEKIENKTFNERLNILNDIKSKRSDDSKLVIVDHYKLNNLSEIDTYLILSYIIVFGK